ncbi:MAG: response regulator [Bowdeniella nasicola]|nr:response regulator [Bowdeniella nasicola]
MRLAIIVLEDEAEVRQALARDLTDVAAVARVEFAEDVPDAREVLAEIAADGDVLALVLADHRLPGQTGVDFLVELQADPETATARTVLVTGQADQDDTIRAVNQAGLDHYIAKPWRAEQLHDVVRTQLTDYVLEAGLDPLPHLRILDGVRVMDSMRRG